MNGKPQDLIRKPLMCIKEHPDGDYTVGKKYTVVDIRKMVEVSDKYTSVRIRDNKRERKDFNFNPASKNYLWRYFSSSC